MDNVKFNEVGERIRKERLGKSLTQENLAEMSGISPSYLGHIERATRTPSVETMVSVCSALEVSLDYVLRDEMESSDNYLISIIQSVKKKDVHQYERLVAIMKILVENSEKLK